MIQLELLIISKGIDEILKDNDIDPCWVLSILIEEGLVDLDDYFEEEEEEE